jgi:D-alanyl-lipoteichoic acid acyltransferase DltB (MBOAT superfamily)
MTFVSIEYWVFLVIVFLLYWVVFGKDFKKQNVLVLIASYMFYGWWDWRFLLLIFISSFVDFTIGQGLVKVRRQSVRKLLLYVSLCVNLGILFIFKYYNFFLDTFKSVFGMQVAYFDAIDLILPVGISFYTLQTIGYTIDVYQQKIEPTKDVVVFFSYVAFFPQLVAGPIERATHLLPQFQKKRRFSYRKASDGMRQILWGCFKKVYVADHSAFFVNDVFENPMGHNGSTLFLALIVVSFQFYCDFSGYSDIAIGSARLLGFNLSKNFDYPFFSRNVSEFWNKWHISLIRWLRHYILYNLKGFSKAKMTRNIFIVFLITGLWHGANYTYVLWGILHAFTFLPLLFGKRQKYRDVVGKGKILPTWSETLQMVQVFLIFAIIGVFFRIDSVQNGVRYLIKIFGPSFFEMPNSPGYHVALGIFLVTVLEWLQRTKNHGLDLNLEKVGLVPRWALYVSLTLMILFFGSPVQDFVYFQF